jgi:hypothetical protein
MTSAYLGRIEGMKQCSFWTQSPSEHGFDPAKLIRLDLSKTPNAALAGEISWDAVEVDDCISAPNGELSGTTLGPGWPELQIGGAVLLEQRFIASLPDRLRPEQVSQTGYACEYMSTLYWPGGADARAGIRYGGHHAEIIDERGPLAKLRVYPPGTSRGENRTPVTMWIDLESPEQCDAGSHSLTEVGVGDRPKSGAVYLASGKLVP